jgi:Tol biopolymer transport system component
MSQKRWMKHIILSLLVAVYVVLMPLMSVAQSNIEQFGQNRVQERKFDWKYFDTRHFRVYHYDKAGRHLGRYVAEEAEFDIAIVEKKLGGVFPPRFNIILYNSYDEYRQSNVGLKEESPLMGNSRAGSLKIVDDKLVVYFTGVHADLRRQIRSGMALVVMQKMIFGDNLKKMVKNALLLNLPQWVTDGYIAYLVDGWDEKSNSEWKGILDANPKKGFYELAELHPELGGKAFWKFVDNQYGPATVKTLLYGMQQKSGLNKAMKDPVNLKMKVTVAYDSCMKYYRNVYVADEKKQDKPDSTNGRITIKVPKDNSILRNIRVSPSGRDISYVAWKDGQYTVYMQKTTGSQTITKLLEGGQKDLTDQIDPSYPMLAWSKSGDKLAILYRAGSTTLLRLYNNNRGRIENYKIPKNRFDRVLSMAFMEDDKNLVFSAIKKSQTDLYQFSIRGSKMTNITDDVWDDLSPEFISGGSRTGILFLSNRPQPNIDVPVRVNELPAGPVNVFFYNTRTMQKELLQCSDVKKGRITQPVQYGLDNFAYLHDSNGINNKYVVLFARNKDNKDSAYTLPVTNYITSVVRHEYSPTTGDVTDVVQLKDKYIVYYHNAHMPGDSAAARSMSPTILSVERQEPVVATEPANSKGAIVRDPSGVVRYDQPVRPQIKSGNVFQSEFSDNEYQTKAIFGTTDTTTDVAVDEAAQPEDSTVLTVITDSAYLKMKPAKYMNSFKPDYLSVKLDNTILFNQYQSIATNGGQFANPSLAALTTISLNELMEDHRFTAGFQLPVSGANATYFLQYQNFKRKVDWGLLFLRSQNKEYKNVGYVDGNNVLIFVKEQLFKTTTHIAKVDFSRPIDRLRSVRFNTLMREDRFVQKVTDTLSLALDFSNTESYTSMSRLEFVFDNTISPAINILNGTRYKVYTEYFVGLNNGKRSCYNIGLDFRHYQKLYKNFILANRVAYAHSDGSSMVQYLMGGVDNWMFPQRSANANQAPAEHFGFQMLATSLRGYNQYARTGNNFGVVSTELRLPVVTTFVKRPVQSPILKNLQLVTFVDAGTAWKGFLPDAGNLSTTYNFPNFGNPQGLNNVALSLTVPNSGGLGVGYGAGLRTSLSGYFVRLDAAWNIEGKPKPIIYFALGTDF